MRKLVLRKVAVWGFLVGVLGGLVVQAQVAGEADARAVAGSHQEGEKILGLVLAKNREREEALDHYASDRTYELHYAGTGGEHRAAIAVHAEFDGPAHKTLTVVSTSGSKFLCDKVLRRLVESEQEATAQTNRTQMTLSPANYDAELLGEETVAAPDGGAAQRAWVVQVSPRVDNKFTYRGKVWISEDDDAVMRIQAEPAKSPSWWVNRAQFEARYVRRGQIWLPARTVSSSHVRIGGEATLTIDYGTYPVVSARAVKTATQTAEGQGLKIESQAKDGLRR